MVPARQKYSVEGLSFPQKYLIQVFCGKNKRPGPKNYSFTLTLNVMSLPALSSGFCQM